MPLLTVKGGMVYQLTAKSGDFKGATWTIGDRPLRVGRASDCDVRIPDPIISRHHFELSFDDGALRFKDLGGLNAVLINGSPSTGAVVMPGDELRVGRYAFLVARTAREDDEPEDGEELSRGTLSEEESVFLSSRSMPGGTQARESSDAEFDELFRASRLFSRTTSVPELIDLIKDVVRSHFQPDRAWLLLLQANGEHMIPLTGTEVNASHDDLRTVRKAMLDTLSDRRGTLLTKRVDRSAQGGVICILAAPIILGEVRIGAVALDRAASERAYQKGDLHFLVALAHVAAPFFKAIEKVQELEQENRRLRLAEEKQARMLGTSKAITQLQSMIRVVAPAHQPVLILGPTGTGKELVACLIHELSDRATGPFITVNCAAIPRELFESEFFGHEKGAFTGAVERKIGLMEQSSGGTLFLDEIGDLASEHQARILRAVETGVFRRVGGKQEVSADLRVVAATNKDLVQEIEQGRFREDLYHWLKAIELRVPPLSQRQSDIPELAEHFLAHACTQAKQPAKTFSPAALEYLVSRSWPGNVRQLKSVVEAANTFCRSDTVDVRDFPPAEQMDEFSGPPLPLAEMERLHIIKALDYTHGNMVETAKLLGIGRSTLYVKLDQYGLK